MKMEEQRKYRQGVEDEAKDPDGALHFRTTNSIPNDWCRNGCPAYSGWEVGRQIGMAGADRLLKMACDQCDLKAAPMWEAQYVRRVEAIPLETLPADSPWWLVWCLSLVQAGRRL